MDLDAAYLDVLRLAYDIVERHVETNGLAERWATVRDRAVADRHLKGGERAVVSP